MIIHMVHPQHGEMNVYLEDEAKANELNGWTRATTIAAPPPQCVAPPAEPLPAPIYTEPPMRSDNSILAGDLRTQYIAKFGRPPHHRMLESSIRAAVMEQ